MNEDRCTICLELLDDQENLEINCGHKFHKTCIVNWFRSPMSSGNCPLCNDNPHRSSRGNNNYWYQGSNTQKIINARYMLIKKDLNNKKKTIDKNSSEYNKIVSDLNLIDKINLEKKKLKDLENNNSALKKDEHYKKIKADLQKSWKDIWKTRNGIMQKQIKIVSKHPCIFI
jgi:hypothetical protein